MTICCEIVKQSVWIQFDKRRKRKRTLSDTITNVENDSSFHIISVEGECPTDSDVKCRNTKLLYQQLQKLFLLFVRSKCGFSEKNLSNESPKTKNKKQNKQIKRNKNK
jgi:hypothetical protein